MGKDDSWVSSFSHTPINWTGNVGSDDFGGFTSAQYGWSHPHQHHGSTDMIAVFNGDNSTAGSADSGGFAQYGSGSHSHHHQNDAAIQVGYGPHIMVHQILLISTDTHNYFL